MSLAKKNKKQNEDIFLFITLTNQRSGDFNKWLKFGCVYLLEFNLFLS